MALIGQTILGYTIKEKIGSGGFGTVYRSEKINQSGTYIRAIKHISLPTKKQYNDVLNSMGGDYSKADDYFAAVLKDIVSEIQILNNLTEQGVRNVVSYYENQIDESRSPLKYDIYIMMEYLTSFPDYLEQNTFAVKDVIKLGKDILTALIACHKNRIIHRDIKGDNIFVANDGTFKLGDFGVSKKLQERSRAESMKGTPDYIAPEVYLGKQKYDNTVDLYSLGIVLYKLLNYNRNPFIPKFPQKYDSEDEEYAFEMRMKGTVPELPFYAENRLGEAVRKAILPRQDRYNNADEFYEELCIAEQEMSVEELNQIILENMAQRNSDRNSMMDSIVSGNHVSDVGIQETVGAIDMASNLHASPSAGRNGNLFETVGAMDISGRGTDSNLRQNDNLFKTVGGDNISESAFEKTTKNTDKGSGIVAETLEQRTERSSNRNMPQMPYVAPIEKKNFRWIIYVLPFAIVLTYLLIYYVCIPKAYDYTISMAEWALKNPQELLEKLKSSESVLPSVYKIVGWKVLNYMFYAAFIVSLYFLGRNLHFSKPDYAVNAGLKGKEAYYLSMQICEELKAMQLKDAMRVIQAVKTINDRLRNESEFGYGSQQVIQCEHEIADNLGIIQRSIADLQSESAKEASKQAVLQSCNNIMTKLKIRTELKKK